MNNQKQPRRQFLGASLATLALGITSAAQRKNQTSGNQEIDKPQSEINHADKANEKNLTIAILLYDKMTALDAVGPYEVLSRLPNATVKLVGETAGLKTADSKMLTLRADYSIDEVPRPNVLLIPGGDPRDVMNNPKALDWVRAAHRTSRFTASVCTGAMILAAAGLLRNQKATTHWATADLLPKFGATYVAERWVQNGKIITAAGVSAGLDMALALAAQLTDERTAKMIQLIVEYDPQPPFDAGSTAKAGKQTVSDALGYFERRREADGRAK